MADTRDQSVRDVLDVDFTFMFCRLAHGNDADVIGLLGVNDGNENAIEQAKSYSSLLAVSDAIVFIGKRDAIENLICIGKIEPVLLDVRLTLSLVPVDHKLIVYTIRIFVNIRHP